MFRLILVVCGSLALVCGVNAEESSHHGHTHHFSVLAGVTDFDEEGTVDTIGFDYEYRVSDFLGLGVVVEHAKEELDAWTYLLVADLHITNHWIIQAGPGYEHTDKHDLFVYRIGTLYEFELGRFTLSPQVHFDYHDGGENAVVYGIALGVNF